jgi:uncharacterized protein YaaN involved in tellurite resistance
MAEKDLDSKASEFADKLTDFSVVSQDQHEGAVQRMGEDVQLESSQRLKLLQQPLKKLSKSGEEGGNVAKSLINLKLEVEKLDPAKFDFEAGWFSRILGMVPGVGTPLKRYFSQYESAQTVIDAIINSLKEGKDELKRDNITLVEDQKFLKESADHLKNMVALAQKIDEKLVYKADREFAENPEKKAFIEEKLIFALRQRIMDFQQQLAVIQQGIISIDIIQKNNQELIRGVDRSLNVTVNALQVAATVAVALNNQKIVLDKVTALNQTTDKLIAGTASRIKTQGVEIQQQASSAQLDINTLKLAFDDISQALTDISSFRQKALPEMASTVLELDKLTGDLDNKIGEMEKAKALEASVQITLDEKTGQNS